MSIERFDQHYLLTALTIPELDSLIGTSTCNCLTVRAKGDADDNIAMPGERFDLLTALAIPCLLYTSDAADE